MKKIIAYGIGKYLEENHRFLPTDMEIVAYADGNTEKSTSVSGRKYRNKEILSLHEMSGLTFDYVYICVSKKNETAVYDDIVNTGQISVDKIRFLSRLRAYSNWDNYTDENGMLISDISGVRIRETNKNDRAVLSEVFGNRVYNIDVKKNTIVIDFGMNVGTTSLFFASNINVEKVYGFEPFVDTYEAALKNIQLSDKRMRDKIITYNCAVSDFEGFRDIPVMTEFSGGRTTELAYLKDEGNRIERVLFKKAEDVLIRIINENSNKHIVWKIDVEGSEFEIFDSIRGTQIMPRIDAILMEYHRNPESIEEYMRLNGFRFIRTGDNELGMIYAINMDEKLQ